MIRIIKKEAPKDLIKKGTARTIADNKLYHEDKEKYNSGELKFEAISSIYNSDVVREALEDIQKINVVIVKQKALEAIAILNILDQKLLILQISRELVNILVIFG